MFLYIMKMIFWICSMARESVTFNCSWHIFLSFKGMKMICYSSMDIKFIFLITWKKYWYIVVLMLQEKSCRKWGHLIKVYVFNFLLPNESLYLYFLLCFRRSIILPYCLDNYKIFECLSETHLYIFVFMTPCMGWYSNNMQQ